QPVKCPSCRATFTLKTRSRVPPRPSPEAIPLAAEEEPGRADPSPPEPAEDAVRPARKRRRKKKPSAPIAIPWVWIGAGAGAILLVLFISCMGWLLSGSGTGGTVNVSREPEDSPHRLAASSLPPQPATWKVAPDGVQPARKLRSVFPVPAGTVEALLFSAP